MYEFTFTLLPTEICMPCTIHQLVNPLLFTYLAFEGYVALEQHMEHL